MTTAYLERENRSLDLVLLGSYFAGKPGLPSWSPNYFRFDELPNDRTIFDHVCWNLLGAVPQCRRLKKRPNMRLADAPRQCVLSERPSLNATLSSLPQFTILGSVLCAASKSLRTINSTGWMNADERASVHPSRSEIPCPRMKNVKAWRDLWHLCALFDSPSILADMAPFTLKYFVLSAFSAKFWASDLILLAPGMQDS